MDKNFKNSRVLVCGLARSGFAAAKLLLEGGASVTVSDLSPSRNMYADELERLGAKLHLGKNPDDDMIKSHHYIVISPAIPIDTDFILKAKKLGIPVIAELELGYMACNANIAAITGTNGKTTAVTILGNILKRSFPASETLGNIGAAFCEKAASVPRDAWVSLEVSSFQLESVRSFRPRISAVLNISEDHLNRHYTMENYIASKERIFENQRAEDFVVLNLDDHVTRGMAARAKSQAAYFTLGSAPEMSGAGEIGKDTHAVYVDKGSAVYSFGNYRQKLFSIKRMKTPFRHVLADALAAALIAVLAGARHEDIAREVHDFTGVPHRVELVGIYRGAEFYNDSKATNVDAAVKALSSIDGKVILIGGGQDKGADFSEWTKLFPGKVKQVFVYGETAGKIVESCKSAGFVDYMRVKDLREAVSCAKLAAAEGDRVLLSPACASLDMFKDFEERGELFRKFVMSSE